MQVALIFPSFNETFLPYENKMRHVKGNFNIVFLLYFSVSQIDLLKISNKSMHWRLILAAYLPNELRKIVNKILLERNIPLRVFLQVLFLMRIFKEAKTDRSILMTFHVGLRWSLRYKRMMRNLMGEYAYAFCYRGRVSFKKRKKKQEQFYTKR